MDKTAGRRQFYGWTSNLLDLSSSMDGFGPTRNCPKNMPAKLRTLAVLWMVWAQTEYWKQPNCWTSAVLWMVLGPPKKITRKLLDIISFMDGLSPKESILSKLQALAVQWMGLDWTGTMGLKFCMQALLKRIRWYKKFLAMPLLKPI